MASPTSRSPPAPACSPTTAQRYPQQFQGPCFPLRSHLLYRLTHLSWFLSAETEGGGGFTSNSSAQRDSPGLSFPPGESPKPSLLPSYPLVAPFGLTSQPPLLSFPCHLQNGSARRAVSAQPGRKRKSNCLGTDEVGLGRREAGWDEGDMRTRSLVTALKMNEGYWAEMVLELGVSCRVCCSSCLL